MLPLQQLYRGGKEKMSAVKLRVLSPVLFSNRLSWRSVWKGSERRRPDRGQGLLGKVFSSLPRLSLLFTAAVKTQEALASHFGLHTAVFNE